MKSVSPTPPPLARAQQTQFGVINLLKAVAAQLIVLHHLAFYGPMADFARPLLPGAIDWLRDEARIAVQVFLVIGGFLAAKSLASNGNPGLRNPASTILRRYLKLAPPFMAAMLLAIAASALAGMWMTHDAISKPPGMAQMAAHALLLHDVLGVEALSAGAWYVGIDFQLYALLCLLLWAGGRVAGGRAAPWLMPAVIAMAVGASLLYFNLDADWDGWALYFVGSYGLGVLAWWAGDRRRSNRAVAVLLCLMAVPALVALTLDFRSRIALALVTACVLVLVGRARVPSDASGAWGLVNGMGKISYAIFLVHFPVCLVINALFFRYVPHDMVFQAIGTLLAWGASVGAGAAFHRWVETPIGRALSGAVAPAARRGPQPAAQAASTVRR